MKREEYSKKLSTLMSMSNSPFCQKTEIPVSVLRSKVDINTNISSKFLPRLLDEGRHPNCYTKESIQQCIDLNRSWKGKNSAMEV